MNSLAWITKALLLVTLANAFDVKKIEDVAQAKKTKDIKIKDLHVPAGVQLDLTNLLPGTVVEFSGHVTFGYAIWDGPLVKTSGKNIKIIGKSGNLIDADGKRWWGPDENGKRKKKLRFFENALEDSYINGLYLKNAPEGHFINNNCKNLLIENVTLDTKDGDKLGAINTDGFGVGFATNVTIRNCYVHNQDDCFCTGMSSGVTFENNVCVGGHGISIGSMGLGRTVENLIVRNCVVKNSLIGIRIKSRTGETGLVKNVLFENIELQNINRFGIIIHSNYPVSDPTTPATPFPMEDITINNVHGTVTRKGTNVLVWVAPGSAKNWKWNSNVTGGRRQLKCGGVPNDLNMSCGKK